jgi:hypothetical protein
VHRDRVEPAHRLVEKQQLRRVEQALRHAHLLPHALRAGGDAPVAVLNQAELLEPRCHFLGRWQRTGERRVVSDRLLDRQVGVMWNLRTSRASIARAPPFD